MSALICGSIAYDTIMVFPGRFKDHILPDKIHLLNVSFLVPNLRREFGGCAGNIAFNLRMLGGEGHPMGCVGRDFDAYRNWMKEWQVSRKFVRVLEDQYTAQAYITTDMDDNQITAFHPGAMNCSQDQAVPTDAGIRIGVIAPDGRAGMMIHAQQLAEAGIPFIFDPGQGLPLFNGDELKQFIEQASWIAVNDYECQLLQERTGLSPAQIAERVKALVVTRGGEGAHIYTGGGRVDVPAVKASELVDPTGCGDAFRAGMLYGLLNDLDWETTGRVAALMGSIKIETHGTQNHIIEADDFNQRFEQEFGYAVNIAGR